MSMSITELEQALRSLDIKLTPQEREEISKLGQPR